MSKLFNSARAYLIYIKKHLVQNMFILYRISLRKNTVRLASVPLVKLALRPSKTHCKASKAIHSNNSCNLTAYSGQTPRLEAAKWAEKTNSKIQR